MNRLFVLSFENNNDRTEHTEYFLPKVKIKDWNGPINGQNFFDQCFKNNFRTSENKFEKTILEKEMITQLVSYSKKITNYIDIDLTKQQHFDNDPNEMQQIYFSGNLD